MLFAYRLALALGQPNVDAMLAGITATQFRRWSEFALLEPFGEERADIRNAILCRLVAIIAGNKNAKLDDFMPRFGKPKQRQDWRVTKANIKMHLMGRGLLKKKG